MRREFQLNGPVTRTTGPKTFNKQEQLCCLPFVTTLSFIEQLMKFTYEKRTSKRKYTAQKFCSVSNIWMVKLLDLTLDLNS